MTEQHLVEAGDAMFVLRRLGILLPMRQCIQDAAVPTEYARAFFQHLVGEHPVMKELWVGKTARCCMPIQDVKKCVSAEVEARDEVLERRWALVVDSSTWMGRAIVYNFLDYAWDEDGESWQCRLFATKEQADADRARAGRAKRYWLTPEVGHMY